MRKFFEKLLESKLIPSGSELIEPKDFDKKCIRMSDFMNIKNEDEKIGCSRKVIADNANFVCFDSNGAHSANTNEPEFLYRTSISISLTFLASFLFNFITSLSQ